MSSGIVLSIFIWFVLPVLLVVWLASRDGSGSKHRTVSEQLAERDRQWWVYLSSFGPILKTKAEKRLLEVLLAGQSANQLYLPDDTSLPRAELQAEVLNGASGMAQAAAAVPVLTLTQVPDAPKRESTAVDNTTLLLYFGAFLLVASVGLFVAVGGLGGVARTIIVGITAGALYYGGMWLYETNKKLAQAGISFVGTGMMIAPLTGVAWYNLVAHHTQGGVIWLVTSMACIALYMHAFGRIKNSFYSYLLIGSFVSTIESAVLTIQLPAYGFAWGLIVAGLLLMVLSRTNAQERMLIEAEDNSAQLLVPLSILGSILLLGQYGGAQLAITLFLSGVYYSILAYWVPDKRHTYSEAAQAVYIAAVITGAYAIHPTTTVLAGSSLAIAILYCLAVATLSKSAIVTHNVVTIASLITLTAAVFSVVSPWLLAGSLASAVFLSLAIWIREQNDTALQVGGLTLIALPYVLVLYALHQDITSGAMLLAAIVASALLSVITLVCTQIEVRKMNYQTASILVLLSAASLAIPAWLTGFEALLGVLMIVTAIFLTLRHFADDTNWLLATGVATLILIVQALFTYGADSTEFSVAVLVGVAANVALSFLARQAAIRWMAVGCILLAPVALGGGGLGFHWSLAGYTGGYMLAMASCILARAIARGRLLFSAKMPIAGYYTEASEAYVFGYAVSAVIAVAISLFDINSQLLTSVTLTGLVVAVVLVAYIEKNREVYACLPVLAQALLFSAIRPDLHNALAVGAIGLVSSALAAAIYETARVFVPDDKDPTMDALKVMSVVTAFIGPALGLTQSHPSMLQPVSLFIAGLITFDHNKHSPVQSTKELSLGICIAAVHWLIYLAGYTNIHIHTHVLAIFLAGFAYWRSTIGDGPGTLSYIRAAYLVITVPLALQAMSGESGGLYGLILIVEQVFFMLIGSMLGVRFLIQAGLWTGLAAILYQLRGLGWAFMTLLALIVIGVAVYRLQKHPPN